MRFGMKFLMTNVMLAGVGEWAIVPNALQTGNHQRTT